MSDEARAVIDKVKAELPEAWLGGRQRVVLEEAIAAALREARATGAEACATRLDREAEDWVEVFAVRFKEAALLCRARAAVIRKGEG